MFEYWFTNLSDDQGTFDHTGTTHDFLEVLCQIAGTYGEEVAGHFVRELLAKNKSQLSFLRVVEWKIHYQETHLVDNVPTTVNIKLVKYV
jgi:hypothetical protein